MVQTVPKLAGISARALEIAGGYADAGTHEEGGNNRGDQVQFFQRMMGGVPGDPWCADFVSTCLIKAYAQRAGLPEGRADLPHYVEDFSRLYFRLSGRCPTLWEEATAHYRARQAKSYAARPGDLVLFDFASVGEPHHVEFVLDWRHGRTIGGNTASGDSGSQRDGDGVFRRTRSPAHVYGFISLN